MEPARTDRRRLVGVLVLVPFALVLFAPALLGQPPARLPSHWGTAGVDGTTSTQALYGTVLSVAAVCGLAGAGLSLLSALVPSAASRWILTVLAAVGAGAASAYAGAVLGTRAAGGDATEVGTVWGPVPVLLGVLWGALAYLVHGLTVPSRQDLVDAVPERSRVVPVAGAADPGTRWATQVRSGLLRGTAVFTAVVFAVCVVLVWSSGPLLGLLLAVLGLAMTLFVLAWSAIEVGVDDSGLTVRSGVLPVGLAHVPAGEVLGVETLDLDPMRWGGYGLRGLPDRTAYIVRGGPGLVVHRASGRRLALEIPAGEQVAAAGARALLLAAGRALAANG